MSKVLMLGVDPASANVIEAALAATGHAVSIMPDAAAVRDALKRQTYALLFIVDAVDGAPDKLAVEAEQRGVRTIVMTQGAQRLDALRAKGLIAFEQPASSEALAAAVQARL